MVYENRDCEAHYLPTYTWPGSEMVLGPAGIGNEESIKISDDRPNDFFELTMAHICWDGKLNPVASKLQAGDVRISSATCPSGPAMHYFIPDSAGLPPLQHAHRHASGTCMTQYM